MPPQLSLTELYDFNKKKELSKHISYDKVIEMCHKKIKKIAQAGGMNIFFEIPYIVIGLPLYNINNCIEYVVNSLRKNGLLVQILAFPNNNTLYISWSPADVNIKPTKYLENNNLNNNNNNNNNNNINNNNNNNNRRFLELTRNNRFI